MRRWPLLVLAALLAAPLATAMAGCVNAPDAVSSAASAAPASAAAVTVPAAAPTTELSLTPVTVIARFPHDPRAFTQGLIVDGDTYYESTGREGRSGVRRVDLRTGAVQALSPISGAQFGEGLARWHDELISLTWRDGIAHRWSIADLSSRGDFRYTGEGWGLAATADALVLSDGTNTLRFLDPATFIERRRIAVTLAGRPINQLNELEVIDGRIWANIWMTSYIVVIDPATGVVSHVLDLRAVVADAAQADPDAVLNGIAFDARTRRLFVTGKLWPTLYELQLPRLD
jgi:glutaminyl-peptide cyclotransferase